VKFIIAAFIVLCSSAPAAAWKPPTLTERAIVETALRYSYGVRDHNRDPFTLLEVLRIEGHPAIRVPDEFRGMSLAIGYREARWSNGTVGDGGLARGWAQMHPVHRRRCNNFDRSSAVGSMRCILWRMRTTYQAKAYPKCRRQERLSALHHRRNYNEARVERNAWIFAWRWIMSGKRPVSCDPGKPRLHLSQLRCWQRGESYSGICRGHRRGWRGDLEAFGLRAAAGARYGDPHDVAAHRGNGGAD